EVPEEVVDGQLQVLQQGVASLAPVEGRLPRPGDVAVIDIMAEDGQGQRNYVVELGTQRLLEEIDDRLRALLPGDSDEATWDLVEGGRGAATIPAKERRERVPPPLDDSLATAASEFDTLAELRADIADHIRTLFEREAESQFRMAAVDELLKVSNVEPAALVV